MSEALRKHASEPAAAPTAAYPEPLADLIPQLHEQVAIKQALAQILLLAAGFLVMLFLRHHAV